MNRIKAADLNRGHLGLVASVAHGTASITDMLSGVSHVADLIDERRISEEVPTFTLGRITTLLTFARAGSVQINGNAEVQVRK